MSSSLITTFANQIVLLPVLASVFSETEYGTILTVVGIKNIISGTLGNSLYSTRLVMDSRYKEQGQVGDFNLMATMASVIGAVAMAISFFFVKDLNVKTLLLLLPLIAMSTLNNYFGVWYPLKLEFKKGLVNSLVISVGTLLGVAVMRGTHIWPISYLGSAVFGFIFVTTQTGVIKEGFKRTNLFATTSKKWFALGITTLLVNIVTYLDRLILFPLLGGGAVATFHTASYFGKAVSILAMPVASVLLGYYAQKDFKMTLKKFWLVNALCGVTLLVFAVFSAFLGEAVTGLLFPKLVQEAAPYIFIANMASATAAVIQLVQSASLKYAKTYWQVVMQVAYLGVYFGAGMILMQKNGLMGFCIAFLLANITRLVMLLVICHYSIKNEVVI